MNYTYLKQLAAVMFCLLAGILFFCFYHGWLLVALHLPGMRTNQTYNGGTASKGPVTIWYGDRAEFKHEDKEIVWSQDMVTTCNHLIDHWLSLLDEEGLIQKTCTIQAISIAPHGQELFISFDHAPFDSEDSIYKKWMIIESLLKTLKSAHIPIQSVRFLVDHRPMADDHLDFSQVWPLSGFIQDAKETKQCGFSDDHPDRDSLTIMLDPAGDAQRTGRVISDMFERGITVQYAEKLKTELEKKVPGVRVLLTRVPGETLDPLQNAAFANRLGVDLYVSLHFYQEKKHVGIPIDIYFFSYNPPSDHWYKPSKTLSLLPYNQAYLPSFKRSVVLSQLLKNCLEKAPHSSSVVSRGPHGVPFKPLIGITAPALACEVGLHNKDDWKSLVPVVADALGCVLNYR